MGVGWRAFHLLAEYGEYDLEFGFFSAGIALFFTFYMILYYILSSNIRSVLDIDSTRMNLLQ